MKITFLGTGGGEGIPCIACKCKLCETARKKQDRNARKRTSLLLETKEHRILIDTPPEISDILNQKRVFFLSAILLTHEHFDHIGGLTEFEYWPSPFHLFAGSETIEKIVLSPRLRSNCLLSTINSHSPIKFDSLEIIPFRVTHGTPAYGFICKDNTSQVAYFGDASSKLTYFHHTLIKKSHIVIFNTVVFGDKKDNININHISVKEVIRLSKENRETQFILTHISHNNLLHEELMEKTSLYNNIKVAYDDMEIVVENGRITNNNKT